MYDWITGISNYLSQPLANWGMSYQGVPILFAFILGVVGSLAPCQFSGNLGAIAIYGNKTIQQELAWKEVLLFIFGKLVVFSGLGLLVYMLGTEIKSSLTMYFPWFRKMIGPLFIVIGLFLIGLIKFRKTISFGQIPLISKNKKGTGAFLMGIGFTLGFCPTMFVLFFITLMPIVLTVNYGAILPGVFAIGTSIPLIIAIILMWVFNLDGKVMKNGRKIGSIVQKVMGTAILLMGIIDTLTYWTL